MDEFALEKINHGGNSLWLLAYTTSKTMMKTNISSCYSSNYGSYILSFQVQLFILFLFCFNLKPSLLFVIQNCSHRLLQNWSYCLHSKTDWHWNHLYSCVARWPRGLGDGHWPQVWNLPKNPIAWTMRDRVPYARHSLRLPYGKKYIQIKFPMNCRVARWPRG